MDKDGNTMERLNVKTSVHAAKLIRNLATLKKTKSSRLIAIAIDHELERDKPFDFDLTLPDNDEYLEYAHADEAGKILTWIKNTKPTGLDVLTLLRHDIGIPDRKTFLAGFVECLKNDVIQACPAPREYGDKYFYYREKNYKTPRQKRKKATRYEKFLRLKREFGEEA